MDNSPLSNQNQSIPNFPSNFPKGDDFPVTVSPPTPPPSKLKESEPSAISRGATAEEGSDQVANETTQEEADTYWENYVREIELEKKIAEIGGIEKIESGEVKVPENIAKEMGIKPTIEITTPIAKAVDFTVRGIALTDEQLGLGLTKPPTTGFRWLVEWFIYQLRKAHYFVHVVKGKILRIKNSS